MIKKALFILLILVAFAGPSQAVSPLSLDDFVLYADSKVTLDEIADSVGLVGSNDRIDIEKGKSGSITGDLRALGRIKNEGEITVYGDVVTREQIDDDGSLTVSGDKVEGAALTAFALPTLSFTAEGSHIDVPKDGWKILPPGSYGKVEVNKRATLELSSGIYYFDALDTEEAATVKINAAAGDVIINIIARLDIDKDVDVMIAGGTPGDITFNFSGSKEVEIESGAIFRGRLIAPRAEVEFEKGSRLIGAVQARKIEFEKGAGFQPHAAPPASQPLAADAGVDRTVSVGEKVVLDGSESTGATGDALTFEWSWSERPAGSQAAISDVTSATPEFVADIAGTYIAALVVHQGGATSDPDTVTLTAIAFLTDLDDFVIYADAKVELDEIAGVIGNVGSNGKVEIEKGQSGALSGDIQALGRIKNDGEISVTGQLITNKDIDGRDGLSVAGPIIEGASLAPLGLPEYPFSFSSGAPNIRIAKNESLILVPGSYGKVRVDRGARLELAGGEYAIDELDTEDRAMIIVQGPVQIHLKKNLDIDDYVELKPIPSVSTRDVKIYVHGKKVEIDKHAVIRGTLIASQAKVELKEFSRLHGAVYARKIELNEGVFVHHHDHALPPPVTNYRSIGTNSAFGSAAGAATVVAGSSTVTFSGAGLPANIGRGDRLRLQPGSANEEVRFILNRSNEAEVILQTPASGDHAAVNFTIGRAYNSIQAWEDDRQGNLVAASRLEVGVCYSDAPFTDGEAYALATIDGSHTDAERFMWLTAAPGQRHSGIAGSGVILDGENNTKLGIRVRDDYTRIEGLEMKRFRSDDGAAAVEVKDAAKVQLAKLLIHDFFSAEHSVVGIKGSDDSDFAARNCIIYDGDTAGIRTNEDDSTALIENCTIYGMDGRGVYEDDGVFTVKNTIAMANSKEDFDIEKGSQTHNLSSDSTASGAGSMTNLKAMDLFVNLTSGSKNFHLKETAPAVDKGLDLAMDFATDIDGQPRPGGNAWDIGADEFWPAPQIDTFVAEPDFIVHGATGALKWTTRNATAVTIEPDIGPVPTSGTREISPLKTTIYTLTAIGPGGTATASATVTLPVARIVVSGGQLTGEGFYTMVVGTTGSYVIVGTYDLSGDVWVTATSGDQEIKVSGSGGQFSLELPAAGDWQITITEKTGWMRSGSTTLKLAVDDQPPSLTVYGPEERTAIDSFLIVSGEAADDGSGLDSVAVTSSRYAQQSFGATINSLGVFTCEVPLRPGDNQLTVQARDMAGNQTEKTIMVTVVLTGLPIIAITSPAQGAILLEPRVAVAGTVRSSLPPEQIRLLLDDRVQFPTGENGEYTFVFDDVALVPGTNTIQVTAETIYGSVPAQTSVFYRQGQPGDEEILPTIEIHSPLPGMYLNTSTVNVSGTAHSELGISQVIVNGNPAQVTGAGADVSFDAQLVFADDNDTQLIIVVAATDGKGKTATAAMTVYYDDLAPVIQLTSASIEPAPVVNVVTQTPYSLTGTVVDKNLAGITINGQSITVVPAASEDTYDFEARLMLVRDQEQPIAIEAWDFAGNRTGYDLILRLDAALDIEVIAPRDGTELIASADTLDVDVTIRAPGIAEGDIIRVRIDEQPNVTLDRTGSVANGTVVATASDGEHKLTAEVTDGTGALLAQHTTRFSIVNTANIALKLEKQEPANGDVGVETNEFVAVHFNKPIDPQHLQLQVFETAHGLSYASPEKGADITEVSEVKLVEIHRDQEAVPGGVSHFPGNTMTAFYPQRDFAYGATIYVKVIYNSEELARSSFNIRPLPTFIQGFVADQFMAPIAGIDVEIRELGRTATSDKNGSYGFGFGDKAGETIPSGRYRAVVNPDLSNRAFGTVERWVNVEGGRLNSVGVTRLPILNPDEPFRRIASGDEAAVLAGGDLVLNLKDAGLNFPDGHEQGDVHVQFMKLDQIAYPVLPSATPNWAFAIQPMGIEVSGPVAVTISMPPLYGSYDYIAQIGERVLLVGYDPDALQIVPVGVGRVDTDNHKVISEGEVVLERLDYLGYALVDVEKQEILERFANGEISLNQMIGELEAQQ